MRYATAAAFHAALDQRLKTESAATGLGLSRLRKHVAFELFLRRLVQAAPDRWVLKGALALDFRFDVPTRPTKDIDIGRADDEEATIEDMAQAQQLALDDFFTFTATRTDAFEEVNEFAARSLSRPGGTRGAGLRTVHRGCRLQRSDDVDAGHDLHLHLSVLRGHRPDRDPCHSDCSAPRRKGARIHAELRRPKWAEHETKGSRRYPHHRRG